MAPPTVAWTALGAAEVSDFAADKPLVAVNALTASGAYEWNDEGTIAGTDHTLATAPCRRAYDGFPGFVTSPDRAAAADNEWYFVIQAPAAGITFDSAFIIGHNFGTLSLTTVTLEVADNAAFDSNLRELCDFGNPTDDDRLASYSLKHTGSDALRYSDVVYIRLKLNNGGGANFTPSFGELILGRRYQINVKPDRPWDELAYVNAYEETESESGIDYHGQYYRNRLVLDAEWPVTSSSYVTDWRAFWANCANGSFVWSDAPTSAPDSWRMMVRKQNEIDFPLVEPTTRTARLVAREQGPEQYYLANE